MKPFDIASGLHYTLLFSLVVFQIAALPPSAGYPALALLFAASLLCYLLLYRTRRRWGAWLELRASALDLPAKTPGPVSMAVEVFAFYIQFLFGVLLPSLICRGVRFDPLIILVLLTLCVSLLAQVFGTPLHLILTGETANPKWYWRITPVSLAGLIWAALAHPTPYGGTRVTLALLCVFLLEIPLVLWIRAARRRRS